MAHLISPSGNHVESGVRKRERPIGSTLSSGWGIEASFVANRGHVCHLAENH